jgi:hypothetical protein
MTLMRCQRRRPITQGFLGQKLGVVHLGRTRFDILGNLVKVSRQASEHFLQVGLPRYLGQSPSMIAIGPRMRWRRSISQVDPEGAISTPRVPKGVIVQPSAVVRDC